MPQRVPTKMTLAERIAAIAPESLALLAPRDDSGQRQPLQFGGLSAIMSHTAQQFHDLGITPQDRIALVLPNCAEMVSLFMAVVSYGCAAPLNPAYRADELRFYLTDLRAKAVVIAADAENSPAAEVARELGIMVLVMTARTDLAIGHFDLVPQALPPPANLALVATKTESRTSLILHTSGTTARPKIVPLTEMNLLASAGNIAETLMLFPSDRLLGIMPLFHIHGLVAGLLAPLLAGSSIFVTPGFNGLKFFGWLEEAAASWFTAVPTMHSTIVARSDRNRAAIESSRGRLRFIRSSSSALAPKLLREIEEIFACPVVESYGMTEASHQMASTSLDRSQRLEGSVGRAAGPEIAIMDEAGQILPAGTVGEVVIRGANVTTGYENNPTANQAAFSNGWFRTGDQGWLNPDGYLTLNGRLKEMINRGGEKVAPPEIDAAALEHPAVAQAVCFAIPHEVLGEEVALVVVLQPEQSVTAAEIKDFLRQKLADYKIPRQVIFVAEIPKGATGKVQRLGLAQALGLIKDQP